MTDDPLKTEIETFAAHKDELLGKAKGKYVLIKGTQIVGTYENQVDAINAGYEKFGNVPFLVKQILDVDVPVSFTSVKIAV